MAGDYNLGDGGVMFYGGTLEVTENTSIDNDLGLHGDSTVNAGAAVTLSGKIFGSNDLTKPGTGTLTLSGTSNYGGATMVSAGTLSVPGALPGGGPTTDRESGV